MTKSMTLWSVLFLLCAGFIWLFQGILAPFVVGLIVAYFLNPPVNALTMKGLNRSVASIILLLGFVVLVTSALLVVAPLVAREIAALAQDFPAYLDQLVQWLEPHIAQAQTYLGQTETADIKAFLQDHIGTAANVSSTLLSGLLAGGNAFAGFVSFLIFMPIVAFFLMKDWPKMVEYVFDLLPRAHEKTVKDLLKQIDEKLSSFVRGQLSVIVILAFGYAIALTLAGLKYGFLIGFMAGLLSIIPMFGTIVGIFVGVIVAWFQSGDWTFVLLIAGIFVGGQVLEGNVLTPKLVGDSVGLHPLWVFFAILAGGSLLGPLGMLIAVPVAAVAGVIFAYGMKRYKDSALYKSKPKSKAKPRKAKAKKSHG